MKRPVQGIRWLAQRLADVPRHNAWLRDSELKVLETKKVEKRWLDWRLGRWTAKRTLLKCLRERVPILDYGDIEVRAAEDGAPEVFIYDEAAPINISLSHSHGVGFCVIGGDQAGIGCDTEHVEPRSTAFIADYFTDIEMEKVSLSPAEEQPLVSTLIWSAKESVLKAVREGLRRDTRSVVVNVTKPRAPGEWTHFPARCQETRRRFDGWWRSADGQVYTVVREAGPEAKRSPIDASPA
jgi:4'-phosphopantetheinyl transferase